MTDSMENNDVKEAETKEKKKNMGESVKGMAKGQDMINALCLIQGIDMTKVDDSAWRMPTE